ncbi:creatininase family protein [Mameliella sp. AT18]|uniref:creatininase family protein n=1 Tax=Mameliella sp. AT18 TaxID=3028385 RepID=UPI00084105F4|nr:creatininase family protein [Mameliella sp. AT18]MDD9730531.1 creatininase family protein [Mameliella sp. AT18]ODM48079.1 creatininase [Ruegeria sp. PBVC088]
MSVQGYWADLPSAAFPDLPQETVAVLPLGATEQHGPHLPLSVDSDLIGAVADRMLAALAPEQSVLVLPGLTITKSDEHIAFPGTLTLSAETLLAVLREIGASVARAGVTRLVLFNGHGGNSALLQVAARDLRLQHDLVVVSCSWGGFAEWQGIYAPESYAHDIHAGDSETSAMLALRPDRVDMSKARDFRPAMTDWDSAFPHIGLGSKPASPGWLAQDLNGQGACGNAAAATADKGAALLDSAARGFAAFLAEFAGFDHRRVRP